MPELPEVETIVRGLETCVVNRRVVRARLAPAALYRRGSLPLRRLVGRAVTRVSRVGKNAVFHFEPFGVMVVNLGMTGRLVYLSDAKAAFAPREKHLHGWLLFEDGSELRYHDARRFGFVHVAAACDAAGELGIGPDPFQADASYLARVLGCRRAPVKSLLLDQRFLSGIGNIYADETLFAAAVDPRTPGGLAAGRAGLILSSARRVLKRAIAAGGSTIRDYRKPDGSRGDFQRSHAVYGRGGAPCVRCGSSIVKIVLSGRGTHFCPGCQR